MFADSVKRLQTTSTQLASLRDLLLVVAAGVYAVGYCAWTLIASSFGLGTLPTTNSRYFALGGALTAALCFIGGAFWFARGAAQGYREHWLLHGAALPRRLRWMWAAFLLLAYGASSMWMFLNYDNPTLSPLQEFSPLITLGAALVAAPSVVLFLIVVEQDLRDLRPGGTTRRTVNVNVVGEATKFAASILGVPLLVAIFLFLAAFSLWLPQELGGMRPRLARLDIRTGQLSQATLARLGLTTASEANRDQVLSTRWLNVYAFSGEYVLISFEGDNVQTLRIPADAVTAVEWDVPMMFGAPPRPREPARAGLRDGRE